MTITSMEFERISVSAMLSASSPLSGCETRSSSSFRPTRRAYLGSSACSTSMKAARPPRRWASAMTLRQKVVLPDDSGPKISMIRPRGRPPTPKVRSMASEPVEMVSTTMRVALPRRMMDPSPNCLVIAETASSIFLSRAGSAARSGGSKRVGGGEALAGANLDMEFMELETRSFYGKDSTGRRKTQACVRHAFFLQSIVRRKRKEVRGQRVMQWQSHSQRSPSHEQP